MIVDISEGPAATIFWLVQVLLLDFLEDWSSKYVQNVGDCIPVYIVLYPRRLEFLSTLL
jgi:hypothetical protein